VVAPVSAYNWSGFYIGGHVGGVWGNKDWTDVTIPAAPFNLGSHDMNGFLAGGQVGINFQTGNWVFGIEGQASWTNADGDHACTVFRTCRTEANWLGTVSGRLGWAFDRALIYAKGGLAIIDEEYFVNALPGGVLLASTGGDTRFGWMVGGGVEWAIVDNWSVKIEYNFMDFREDSFNFTTPGGVAFGVAQIDQQMHVVKAGLNYRFNWGGPVTARY
jgi:outer membrane immunogenic protein